MRILLWLLRAVVFVALFGLAVKNSGPVELRFYFGSAWQVPLALVVLGSFFLGVLIGLTAVLSIVVRQGRGLLRLRGSHSNSRDLKA